MSVFTDINNFLQVSKVKSVFCYCCCCVNGDAEDRVCSSHKADDEQQLERLLNIYLFLSFKTGVVMKQAIKNTMCSSPATLRCFCLLTVFYTDCTTLDRPQNYS